LYGQQQTKSDPSGLIVLSVTGENVRVRAYPQAHNRSLVLKLLNSGDIVVAEKWTITEKDNTWYRIVGIVDKESGQAVDVLQALPEAKNYPFISASFVQPLDDKDAEQEILARMSSSIYCEGFSVADYSVAAQRKMAEQKILRALYSPKSNTPIYSKPSATSDIRGYYSDVREYYYELVRIDSKPGWMLVVDLANLAPSGWVEEGHIEVPDRDYGADEKEAAYLVQLHLGANIAEIIRRLGTEEVVNREASGGEYGGEDDEDEYYDVNVSTVINGDGYEVRYKDSWNIEVTITRPGAGLGGFFVGVDWCNKEYIEKTFEQFDIDKRTRNDGVETWRLNRDWDGWCFYIDLDFDSEGRISQFKYDAYSIALWH
jgi:hypothetical protein